MAKTNQHQLHSPLVYAEGAKKDNIKIYTIAIGANTRTRTYLYNPNAGDIMRYANGSPVVDVAEYPVDKKILREIAERTNAKFLRQKTRNLYEQFMMSQLEKTDIQLEIHMNPQWPLKCVRWY